MSKVVQSTGGVRSDLTSTPFGKRGVFKYYGMLSFLSQYRMYKMDAIAMGQILVMEPNLTG